MIEIEDALQYCCQEVEHLWNSLTLLEPEENIINMCDSQMHLAAQCAPVLFHLLTMIIISKKDTGDVSIQLNIGVQELIRYV